MEIFLNACSTIYFLLAFTETGQRYSTVVPSMLCMRLGIGKMGKERGNIYGIYNVYMLRMHMSHAPRFTQ